MAEQKQQAHMELNLGVNLNSKLNWLRAAVLGANDGIVSTAGLVIGVAGATESSAIILTAGLAGIIAGAISMAAGEYVSVSSSRDTEHALIEKEKYELENFPEEELKELADLYQQRGLSAQTALTVAKELTAKDAIKAHLDIELGINPDDLTEPWHAAFASAASFFIGAIIPLVVILLPPISFRIPVTFLAVIIALGVTGAVSGKVSGAAISKAVIRVILGGAMAMIITYAVGRFFGVSGI